MEATGGDDHFDQGDTPASPAAPSVGGVATVGSGTTPNGDSAALPVFGGLTTITLLADAGAARQARRAPQDTPHHRPMGCEPAVGRSPEGRERSGRRRARLGWSPWLVALLAVIALIAAFAIARATYSRDVCRAEYNERLGEPWVEVDNGQVLGTTEEAGCGGATPREPEVSEVFSGAYGPTKALAESLSLERWAEPRQELRRLPRDLSHPPWRAPTAAAPDRLGYAAA